jgi:hypothetical protein
MVFKLISSAALRLVFLTLVESIILSIRYFDITVLTGTKQISHASSRLQSLTPMG